MDRTFNINNTDMEEKFEVVNNKLDRLNARMDNLEGHMATMLAIVRRLAENSRGASNVEFPLKNLAAFHEINKKVEENQEKYVSLP